MKRSEINAVMRKAVRFAGEMRFQLPPFAFWSEDEWRDKGEEYDELRQNLLGWDITDFGSGDFQEIGLLMFTIRNGNFDHSKYEKPYAEKLLIVENGQITPYHFHYKKMEDIINRGGGNLMVQMYNSDENERFSDSPLTVSMDGRNYTAPAGTVVRLTPGESITLPCGMYHKFWGEGGTVLVGEVSKVNDDRVDNRFYEPVGRFPDIEEDEPPLYLLSMDYKEF
ncbi:MAG: D-lyxose/D-mannose family sugar isomerase [Oscillospiraceae bacterium]|jgi:D-lyxose ketol-isomerase|nr:D-lyxose/D-mannose family sugar isomerase [Oscillospiraceae bacterium]